MYDRISILYRILVYFLNIQNLCVLFGEITFDVLVQLGESGERSSRRLGRVYKIWNAESVQQARAGGWRPQVVTLETPTASARWRERCCTRADCRTLV